MLAGELALRHYLFAEVNDFTFFRVGIRVKCFRAIEPLRGLDVVRRLGQQFPTTQVVEAMSFVS